MLFVSISLTIGFASCSSDDDDDDNTEDVSGATAAGEKLIQDLQAYQAIEGNSPEALVKKGEAALRIYNDYKTYKENKENKAWKEAYLKAAAKEDVKKYEALNNFLEKDYSDATSIINALGDISKLLTNN